MHRVKQLAIASAIATAFVPVAHGQSVSTFDAQTGIRSGVAVTDSRKEDVRVFDAIRSTEQDKRRAMDSVNSAELARARAAGEIKTEGNAVRAREVVELRLGPSNAQPQMVDARSQSNERSAAPHATGDTVRSRPGGAIVYLADPKPAGRPQISEAARANEHAKYEANRRRASISASEQARARSNEQPRAGAEAQAALSGQRQTAVQPRTEIVSSDLARSGITASERALGEQTARTNDRAAGNGNAGSPDERRARDILSELR